MKQLLFTSISICISVLSFGQSTKVAGVKFIFNADTCISATIQTGTIPFSNCFCLENQKFSPHRPTGSVVIITVSDFVTSDNQKLKATLAFNIFSEILTVGTYPLLPNKAPKAHDYDMSNYCPPRAAFRAPVFQWSVWKLIKPKLAIVALTINEQNSTITMKEGEFIIDSIDNMKRKISGTFNFKSKFGDGGPLIIKEGKFDNLSY